MAELVSQKLISSPQISISAHAKIELEKSLRELNSRTALTLKNASSTCLQLARSGSPSFVKEFPILRETPPAVIVPVEIYLNEFRKKVSKEEFALALAEVTTRIPKLYLRFQQSLSRTENELISKELTRKADVYLKENQVTMLKAVSQVSDCLGKNRHDDIYIKCSLALVAKDYPTAFRTLNCSDKKILTTNSNFIKLKGELIRRSFEDATDLLLTGEINQASKILAALRLETGLLKTDCLKLATLNFLEAKGLGRHDEASTYLKESAKLGSELDNAKHLKGIKSRSSKVADGKPYSGQLTQVHSGNSSHGILIHHLNVHGDSRKTKDSQYSKELGAIQWARAKYLERADARNLLLEDISYRDISTIKANKSGPKWLLLPKEAKRVFPNGIPESIVSLSSDQLKMLAQKGGAKVLLALKSVRGKNEIQAVPAISTTEREIFNYVCDRGDRLSEQFIAHGMIDNAWKVKSNLDFLNYDYREGRTLIEASKFLKQNPGIRLDLIYGAGHDFTRAKFLAVSDGNPRMLTNTQAEIVARQPTFSDAALTMVSDPNTQLRLIEMALSLPSNVLQYNFEDRIKVAALKKIVLEPQNAPSMEYWKNLLILKAYPIGTGAPSKEFMGEIERLYQNGAGPFENRIIAQRVGAN